MGTMEGKMLKLEVLFRGIRQPGESEAEYNERVLEGLRAATEDRVNLLLENKPNGTFELPSAVCVKVDKYVECRQQIIVWEEGELRHGDSA
jgi:hypothetical protein